MKRDGGTGREIVSDVESLPSVVQLRFSSRKFQLNLIISSSNSSLNAVLCCFAPTSIPGLPASIKGGGSNFEKTVDIRTRQQNKYTFRNSLRRSSPANVWKHAAKRRSESRARTCLFSQSQHGGGRQWYPQYSCYYSSLHSNRFLGNIWIYANGQVWVLLPVWMVRWTLGLDSEL